MKVFFDNVFPQNCDGKVVIYREKEKFSKNEAAGFLTAEEFKAVKEAIAADPKAAKHGQVKEICCGRCKLIVLGAGTSEKGLDWQKLGAIAYAKLQQQHCIAVWGASETEACQMALGAELGSYRFDKYFTKKKEEDFPQLEEIYFINHAFAKKPDYKNYAALANAVRYARDLCNEPANYLTPEVFAADIQRLEYLGLKVDILDKKAMKKAGFNLALAVAQGSVNEPRVAVIRWQGNKKDKKFSCGLVGKGVTFDSGGISLKPGAGMGDMKQDMTGAAVVVAVLKALALQKAPLNVVGVVGLVENMPSGSAIRPGDVVTSMSGQTVEILNTDAEGRLVLGDCLWYIQEKYGVKKVIDIATLTGATMRALGSEYAGIFSNDDVLCAELMTAGESSGENLWRLPVNEAYDKMINSDIADMKNLGGANAGGSTAACFLQRYIQPEVKWAHLDIAGVDKEEKGRPLTPKGATAFGVRVLVQYLQA